MAEERAEYKAESKQTTSIAVIPFGIPELTIENIKFWKKQIEDIPETPENKEQYSTVEGMHKQTKKLKTAITVAHKEIKAPALRVCSKIDRAKRQAFSMVQPLIDMSGSRRTAWETEIEKEKDAERVAEQTRNDEILKHIDALKTVVDSCLEVGLGSDFLSQNIAVLTEYPVGSDLFQEHLETALNLRDNGLVSAKSVLDNQLKIEAQAEAQKKLAEENKAEADRLAKIAADQKAEAVRIKAEQDKAAKKIVDDQKKAQAKTDAANTKSRADQEAQAKKLADEKAAFEAEKKAARIALNDSCYTEALSIHRTLAINEFMPSALEMNVEITQARRDAMDAQAKRNMDLIRNRNAVDAMTRNIADAIEMAKPGVDMPEIVELVGFFEAHVFATMAALNVSVSEVK